MWKQCHDCQTAAIFGSTTLHSILVFPNYFKGKKFDHEDIITNRRTQNSPTLKNLVGKVFWDENRKFSIKPACENVLAIVTSNSININRLREFFYKKLREKRVFKMF